MSKFCTHCGNELKPEAKFCTRCGLKVNEFQENSSGPSQAAATYPRESKKQSRFLHLGDGLNQLFNNGNTDKQAILKELFFAFSGRLNRKAYWYRAIVLYLTGLVSFIILGAALEISDTNALGYPFIIVAFVVMMCSYVGLWCLCVRRMHDLDKSGWWLLLFCLPLVNIWLSILICFIKGTEGPNRYGEDPLKL